MHQEAQNIPNLINLALDYLNKNNIAEAEKILKRCYDIDPNNSVVKKELFNLYQNNIENLKKSPYLDYPLFVSLETLAVCQAKCNFCPYPNMDRIGTRMPDELINKVINDLKDIPRDVEFRFAPFKVSDPFADNRLFSIIEKVNQELPNAMIDIYSNGSALTLDKLEKLQNIKNFQYLNISLNYHKKEKYQDVMKLPFERTIQRLEMIHDKLSLEGLPFSVVISRVCDYETDEDFRDWVLDKFPLFQVHTHRRSDWLGQVEISSQMPPDIGCAMWFSLSIMSTGIVSYCCMDGEGKYPLGNINESHVLDVYNSPKFRAVREHHKTRLQSMPCSQCTFF